MTLNPKVGMTISFVDGEWVEIFETTRNVNYRNPSLGLVTKARGCKVAGQEGSPRVQESVKE
jgi:hypothetical protein